MQARSPSAKEKDNFLKITSEGFDFYIARHMLEEDKILHLTIDLTGFWFFKGVELTRAATREIAD